MRIIHCADLHLDSALTTNFDEETAQIRGNEILNSFCRMVDYAAKQGVEAVLIAGDLFDRNTVSPTVQNMVMHQIQKHESISFYYLRGNHDLGFRGFEQNTPPNLFLFGEEWRDYCRGNVVISGLELTGRNRDVLYTPNPAPGKFHIVMLHGQEVGVQCSEATEDIQVSSFRGSEIDYLALGHLHGFRFQKLDGRGIYCYPGCLEPRGFDEPGDHGFVLLDIPEEGRFRAEFVPFASRRAEVVWVDITDCRTTPEVLERINNDPGWQKTGTGDLIKLVLCGECPAEAERNLKYLQTALQDSVFLLRIADRTGVHISVDEYERDRSLKGEFVRRVMAADLPQQRKKAIIRLGLRALAGEKGSSLCD